MSPRAGPLLDPLNESELIELWVRVSPGRKVGCIVYIGSCSEPSERNAMEKRTSDYKVIVGDENTINS